MRRLLEALASLVGQAVVGTTSDLVGLQPAVLDEPEHRRAHEPLADTEVRHDPDQAAEPDRAAARRDGVAENGRDQRTGIATSDAQRNSSTRLRQADFGAHGASLAFGLPDRTI